MTNFAKVAEVKAGDKLKADGGFTCIAEGAILTVVENEMGELCVPCKKGLHSLEGQMDYDTAETYVGLSKVEERGSGGK